MMLAKLALGWCGFSSKFKPIYHGCILEQKPASWVIRMKESLNEKGKANHGIRKN
jgi:hypothetical protein